MLVEVEVTGGENSPLDLHRMFDLLSDPIQVVRVFSTNPMGEDLWCQVTGWSSQGACTAMSALAEDSGEGVVLLIYGGDEGLRLQPAGDFHFDQHLSRLPSTFSPYYHPGEP